MGSGALLGDLKMVIVGSATTVGEIFGGTTEAAALEGWDATRMAALEGWGAKGLRFFIPDDK